MRLWLRLFLATSLPFGLVAGLAALAMKAFSGAPNAISAGLSIGAAAGLFFGLVMTLGLGVANIVGCREVGAGPFQGPHVQRTVDLPLGVAPATARVVRAMVGIGGLVRVADPDGGTVVGQTSWGLRSFGENLRADLRELRPNTTTIVISSHPRWRRTLIDYGKGFQNIDLMSKLLQA